MCLAEKFWRANSNFFPTSLPCAPLRHTAKHVFAECFIFGTRQTHVFAVCQTFTVCFICWLTSKKQGCRVPGVCRAFWRVTHGKKIRLPCAFPLPCAALVCTRQTLRLPGARGLAHGKSLGTRQTHGFR